MEVDCSLSPNPKLARVFTVPIRRTRGVINREGGTNIRQLLSVPSSERTEMSGDDSIARQRTLVGNSLDDE